MLTPSQRSSFSRAIAACNDALLKIEFLEKLAEVYPPLRQPAADLRTRREYLHNVADSALNLDRIMGQS